METSQIANFIRTVPVFHELDTEQIEHLAESSELRDFDPNQIVVTPEENLHELYIILAGEFQLYVRHEASELEYTLARMYPGEYFGAIAVLSGRHSSVSVRAVHSGRAIVLSEQNIDTLFERYPSFGRAMCRSLAAHVESSIDRLATVPFVRLDTYPNLRATAALLPSRVARVCKAIPVESTDDHLIVAMVDPADMRARTFLTDVLRDYHLDFAAVAEEDYSRQAAKLLGPDTASLEPEILPQDLTFLSDSGEAVAVTGAGLDDVLPRALGAAVATGASDLHIEPDNDGGRIRLRLDGKMLNFEEGLSSQVIKSAISRIKIAAEMDITNIRRPQDGRFVVMVGERRVEFRVSATPCQGGEKVVLRLISPNPDFERLENLILSNPVARFAQDLFESPSGLILVTGPTGSGKTTTLYAALNTLESRDHALNIVTVEDPVEYNLPFATQIQANPDLGLDFPSILRTVLRQDPDVILVGEIRDSESAALALEAATTGHLVLSSLHTYSALETIVRLRDLEVKPYLLAAALKGVISQQLVPRLCPGSTEPIPLDDPVIERIRASEILPPDSSCELVRGIDREGGPPGGESGRVGVYEVLRVDDRIRDLIDRSMPARELESALDDNNFFSLAQYCRYLLTEGLVAPERIERILPRRRSWSGA